MSKLIISIRVFNRPDKVKDLLKSLKKIDTSKFHFYFFVDGPRYQDDVALINQSLKEINNYRLKKNSKIFVQKKNLGLKNHWIYCMNQTFQKTDKAIFLEDDLVVSDQFINFISSGLKKYENIEKVKSICGYLPINIKSNLETFFASRTSVWGFGTWKRVWNECKQFMKKSNKNFLNFDHKKKLTKYGYDLHIILAKNIINKESTFAVWWTVNIIFKKGLNLYPTQTLINNNGFDGSGTNCSKTNFYKKNFKKKKFLRKLPNQLKINEKFSSRISNKVLYSKSESFLYLYLNPKIAYLIISNYLILRKICFKIFLFRYEKN